MPSRRPEASRGRLGLKGRERGPGVGDVSQAQLCLGVAGGFGRSSPVTLGAILRWLRSGSACSDGTLYEVGLRFGAVLLVCASLSFDGQYLLTDFFITCECNRFW